MKKIFALILSIAMVFSLTGCVGEYKPPTQSGNQSGVVTPPGEDPTNPSEPTQEPFRVSLVYRGLPYAPENTIQALWTDEEGAGVYTADFNRLGQAERNDLDGDYRVTLSALPQGFTYNPNIYRATNDNREVEITLYPLTPISGTGSDKYENIIHLSALGAYRATITAPGEMLFFQYEPNRSGDYSLRSLIDITANEINPILDIYLGHSQWKPDFPTETRDSGAESNTYTKNFYWKMQLGGEYIGGVFIFAVRAEGLNANAFPIDIDFILDRDGEFTGEGQTQYVAVMPQEEFQTPPLETGTYRSIASLDSTGNNLFKEEFVKFNPQDGYYHLYDQATETYGAWVYAQVTGDSFILRTESGRGFFDSHIKLTMAGKDYTQFITAYSNHSRSGRYPLTEELKIFMLDFCLAQRYFMDGNGWAESLGYNATETSQWLWNCGFYQ